MHFCVSWRRQKLDSYRYDSYMSNVSNFKTSLSSLLAFFDSSKTATNLRKNLFLQIIFCHRVNSLKTVRFTKSKRLFKLLIVIENICDVFVFTVSLEIWIWLQRVFGQLCIITKSKCTASSLHSCGGTTLSYCHLYEAYSDSVNLSFADWSLWVCCFIF